jgi:transcriptional regulator PpsR
VTPSPARNLDLSELSELAPELAATFATIASDIALVIDRDGIVCNVSFGGAPIKPAGGDWIGRAWVDTVTGETRNKIEMLLEEVRSTGVSRRREVNHPSEAGTDIPMAYAAIRLGDDGPVVAAGRDLRAIAAIQKRFLETQQEMERGYWKHRQFESRYRLLFQVATDAVLVVDALTMEVVLANEAALGMFQWSATDAPGKPAGAGIDAASRPAFDELLTLARSTGKPAEIRAHLARDRRAIDVSATPFRSERTLLLLVRARHADVRNQESATQNAMAAFLERTDEAVVITDSASRIQLVNRAFLALCAQREEAQVRGRTLVTILGDCAGTLGAIIERARHYGIAQAHEVVLSLPAHSRLTLEVSAVLMAEGDQECIGLTLRRTRSVFSLDAGLAVELCELADRLNAVSPDRALPAILEAVSQKVEAHLISSCLARLAGDRDAAALELGLTRADLEARIRRFVLGEGSTDAWGLSAAFWN